MEYVYPMKNTQQDGTIQRITAQFVLEMLVINVLAAILVFRMGSPGGLAMGIVGLITFLVVLLRLFQHVDSIVVHRLEQFEG